jgi:hypothetical protein
LLFNPNPQKWNQQWEEIFAEKEKLIEQHAKPIIGRHSMDFYNALKAIGLCLDDFDESVNLSKKVKQLIENGIINFDIIKESTLFATIIMETIPLEELLKTYDFNQTQPNNTPE